MDQAAVERQTPVEIQSESEKISSECKTPPAHITGKEKDGEVAEGSGNEVRKPGTPDRLKVPKAFKYPERYRSPTDAMMSPVTKGLLARHKKGGALLPPSLTHHKIQDIRTEDVGFCKSETSC